MHYTLISHISKQFTMNLPASTFGSYNKVDIIDGNCILSLDICVHYCIILYNVYIYA